MAEVKTRMQQHLSTVFGWHYLPIQPLPYPLQAQVS
jgi:hypothetical protein